METETAWDLGLCPSCRAACGWCHIACSHCKVAKSAWTRKPNEGLIQQQTQSALGQYEVKWGPKTQRDSSLLKPIFQHIPKSILYLDSPKTLRFGTVSPIFPVAAEFSFICGVPKEGWQYTEVRFGDIANQDDLEVRTGQDVAFFGGGAVRSLV